MNPVSQAFPACDDAAGWTRPSMADPGTGPAIALGEDEGQTAPHRYLAPDPTRSNLPPLRPSWLAWTKQPRARRQRSLLCRRRTKPPRSRHAARLSLRAERQGDSTPWNPCRNAVPALLEKGSRNSLTAAERQGNLQVSHSTRPESGSLACSFELWPLCPGSPPCHPRSDHRVPSSWLPRCCWPPAALRPTPLL
jgi:hypothetical protein